jgi:hypothetical protein
MGSSTRAFHIFKSGPKVKTLLAHLGRGFGRELICHAGVELGVAIPGPSIFAPRSSTTHFAIRKLAEGGSTYIAHPARGLVGFPLGKGLDLLVGFPRPFSSTTVDPAVHLPVAELAGDLLARFTEDTLDAHTIGFYRLTWLGLGRCNLLHELLLFCQPGFARTSGNRTRQILIFQAI